jgi:hypothetical protein
MIVGNGASSFIAVVDVVGWDVATWGYVAESVWVRTFAVAVVASATEHAKIWGRREVVCGVPVVSIPGAFLFIFTSEVVHFNGFGHGEEFGSEGGWGWDRFSLSEIGVDARPDFGTDKSVTDGKRPGTPVSELVL